MTSQNAPQLFVSNKCDLADSKAPRLTSIEEVLVRGRPIWCAAAGKAATVHRSEATLDQTFENVVFEDSTLLAHFGADGWTEFGGTFDRFAAVIFYLRNVEGALVLS